jgi:hypothetical protein
MARISTAMLAAALVAAPAHAGTASTCTMALDVDYVAGPRVAAPGDVVRVRMTLGTGSIEDGSALAVGAVRFFLQCNASAARFVPCVEDRPAVAYGGDATITTDCPDVAWSTGHDRSARPNQVVFMPSAPLRIPPRQAAYCSLEFDVTVLDGSHDATPDVVEHVAGLGFNRADAGCDNGLRAAAVATSGLRVVPPAR